MTLLILLELMYFKEFKSITILYDSIMLFNPSLKIICMTDIVSVSAVRIKNIDVEHGIKKKEERSSFFAPQVRGELGLSYSFVLPECLSINAVNQIYK